MTSRPKTAEGLRLTRDHNVGAGRRRRCDGCNPVDVVGGTAATSTGMTSELLGRASASSRVVAMPPTIDQRHRAGIEMKPEGWCRSSGSGPPLLISPAMLLP